MDFGVYCLRIGIWGRGWGWGAQGLQLSASDALREELKSGDGFFSWARKDISGLCKSPCLGLYWKMS